MFHFLHTFSPQPILLELGWLKIHWYGFLIALGALLAFGVVLYLAKQYGLKKEQVYDVTFYLILFGLIGDRLYYVFYAWEYYSQHLLDIIKIWQGGLAIHGAMIAGLLTLYLYCRRHKINFPLWLDMLIIALPLAMAIGRFGNYFNMELFGQPTNLPWGIPISPEQRPLQFANELYFHPTFLYESLWNIMIFVVLFIWHKLRLSKIKKYPDKKIVWGNIALIYFILYSVGRFFNEFLRLDYSPYLGSWRWAQVVSLFIFVIAIIILLYRNFRPLKNLKSTA